MATVKPFKAARPAKEFASRVAAPPYDVLTSEEAREMAKGNPYSFLRVDKSEIDLAGDVGLYDDAVYEKAKSNLQKLIAGGILVRDNTPCYYIYRLTAPLSSGGRSQTGLVSCVSADEYKNGTIKIHELTRADKEADRVRHVEETNANTGPIFLTYKNNGEINAVIDGHTKTPPVYDFVSDDGVRHTVWIIDGKGDIEEIAELFAKVGSLYIADGHHRAAAAVSVCGKKRGNGEYDADAEYNYFLSVAFPDDQLCILEYNRLVKTLNGRTASEFIAEIEKNFIVEKKGRESFKPEKNHTFAMYLAGEWYKLTAREEIIDESNPVASLDVSILQTYLLSPILGIADPRTDANISFSGGARGLTDLEKRVDSGEMAAAFAMYPTGIGELMAIADSGEIMPPKSTWFEPKLRSGLFIHFLD